MLAHPQPSTDVPTDSFEPKPVPPLSATKTRKITKRIKKTRERFRPTKSSSRNDSASATLLRKTNNPLSLHDERTPQKSRKETKETESRRSESEEAALRIARNHKAQLSALGFYAEQNLQNYLQKEVVFEFSNGFYDVDLLFL